MIKIEWSFYIKIQVVFFHCDGSGLFYCNFQGPFLFNCGALFYLNVVSFVNAMGVVFFDSECGGLFSL